MKNRFILTILSLFFFISCANFSNEEVYNPKPKGYNRIDLPVQEFQKFSKNEYPYSFEVSKSAVVLKDTNGLQGKYWVHIYYPYFQSNIEITYEDLRDPKNSLVKLMDISHRLTSKHQIKAYKIEESIVRRKDGKDAAVYELEGDVPSQFQFIYTDSTKHFLRGAVYFATATQNDSLQPVIEFMKKDVIQLINTVEWK